MKTIITIGRQFGSGGIYRNIYTYNFVDNHDVTRVASILSNENIFGIDLYKAGIGEKIEELFVKEIAGPGAVRKTLKENLTD